jgi:hypothetical protein
MRLHGTIRNVQTLHDDRPHDLLWQTLERPAPQHLVVNDTDITRGSRVRLHPRPGGDIFDLALVGKAAVVESIEQDYDDRVHVTVTLEEDPGRDLAGIKPVIGFSSRRRKWSRSRITDTTFNMNRES